jgi:hypothetical protein
MYTHPFLPFNIGGDDLFICFTFLIIFVRFFKSGYSLGYTFWSAVVFLIVLIITNCNSYLLIRGGFEELTKQTLKGVITVLLSYNLLKCIEDIDDLKQVVFAFCFFAGAGAVLVILQNFIPGPIQQIFVSNIEAERAWEYNEVARPSGAFMNSNNASVVLGIATLITITTLGIESKLYKKGLRLLMLGITGFAILATRSRSGFLCLMIPLLLMLVLDKQHRKYVFIFVVIGVIILIGAPIMRNMLFERFSGHVPTGETTGFWEPILLRIDMAFDLWRQATVRRLIFGQNSIADLVLGNLAPHNAYLGLPLVYGVLGTIWEISFFVFLIVRSRRMARLENPVLSSIGKGIRWSLIALLLYGIVGAFFESYYIRYTLFFLAVLAQRGTELGYAQIYDEQNLEIDAWPAISGIQKST